jgi:hypothetical protein
MSVYAIDLSIYPVLSINQSYLIYLSMYVCLSLYVCVSVSLFLSVFIFGCLYLPVCLSVSLYIYVPICLLTCLSSFLFGWVNHADDGGSKYLWNVGKILLDYTVLQPKRQPSSYSLLWEPEILPTAQINSIYFVTMHMGNIHIHTNYLYMFLKYTYINSEIHMKFTNTHMIEVC